MALRRRTKAVENLRLANLQDYVITEDEPDLSPCTTRPVPSRVLPRRINDDTYEDIMRSFDRFSWQKPRIDGIVLCDYRRFTRAMVLPTTEAIEPWVGWVEAQLGWERRWILENPVACKREIVRRFEGEEKLDSVDRHVVEILERRTADAREQRREDQDFEDSRRGAMSRMGFREDEGARRPSTAMNCHREDDPSTSRSRFAEEGEKRLTWRFKKPTVPMRPVSALSFREVKGLKGKFSSLKKKALTNPWQRKANVG
jgi:hypothetical protein